MSLEDYVSQVEDKLSDIDPDFYIDEDEGVSATEAWKTAIGVCVDELIDESTKQEMASVLLSEGNLLYMFDEESTDLKNFNTIVSTCFYQLIRACAIARLECTW